jgi:hypothetical protein
MELVKLPAGYRLPKNATMADVRRLDQELLAGEDLDVLGKAKEGRKKLLPRTSSAQGEYPGRI